VGRAEPRRYCLLEPGKEGSQPEETSRLQRRK
jgi:hypothetical protein